MVALKDCFDKFDVDANGKLSSEEFKKVLMRPGGSMALGEDDANDIPSGGLKL